VSRAPLRALPLAALALVLFLRNRGGWADPLVDFGRELYLPWRIGHGEVLYRDFAYLDGPFSPYWNALWMWVGGVGLATLEWVNLGVVAAAACLFHALLARLGGALTALAGVAVFLSVFAFNLIGRNMNWIAPYSHGVTHGIVWALLSLWLLGRYLDGRRGRDLAGSGLALGFAFLTKPEVAAAGALAVGTGFVAGEALRKASVADAARRGTLLVACATLPLVVAAGLLALAMPPRDAAAGALGGWAHLLGSDVADLYFYRWVMGVDRPAANLRLMGRQALLWGVVLLPVLGAALALRTPGARRNAVGAAIAGALLLLTGASFAALDWAEFLRPLSPSAAAFAVGAALAAWRARGSPDAPRAALQLAFATFALALLSKVLLQPVLWGYSFALAAPAMMVVVLVLVHTIPDWVARRGGFAWLFRATGLALLAIACAGCLHQSEGLRAGKTVEIGRGADRMLADSYLRTSQMIAHLVPWVERNVPPDATLVVMPEGVMVNYLTRRRNPTRQLNFVPPEVEIFGESAILADLRAAPPDYVVLVQRDTLEYRLPLFGIDYARRLLDWVHDDYRLVTRAGAAPLRPARLEDGRTGFEVWARAAPGPAASR
jgi:4-amino-4-deoxy-L-arabinose transferase-like glycosyltransferase